MADRNPWLERELTSQLRPVMAPDGLWEQIAGGARPVDRRRRFSPVLWLGLWPAFAAAVLIAAAAFFLQARTQLREMAQISEQDLVVLADPASGVSFRSEDGSSIRKWVKSRGNIEIELPPNPTGAVHLLGAKLVELRGMLIAVVAYHVGNDSATLLVAKRRSLFRSGGDNSRHLFASVATPSGSNLVSWGMRDQNYAIVSTGLGDPQAGCLLCHAEMHGRL